MRILYVDLNLRYLNPTRSIVPIMLSSGFSSVDYFGPGYVSTRILEEGLYKFIKKGAYDAVIASDHVVFADTYHQRYVDESFKKNYFFNFNSNEILSRKKLLDDIRKSDIRKVALLMESDCYNFSKDQITEIDKNFDLVLAPFGSNSHPGFTKNEATKKEKFYNAISQYWPEYVRKNQDKVFWFPHFISENEFKFSSTKHYDYVVPGTPYYARKLFFDGIKKVSDKVLQNRKSIFIKMLKIIKYNVNSNKHYINFYQEEFRGDIEKSKTAFTCGSRLGVPVRKFFEIPALGTALICDPFFGYENLGFKEDLNFIKWSPGESFSMVAEKVSDDSFIAKITNEGRELILDKHTVKKRSIQINLLLEIFLKTKSISSCRWVNGDVSSNSN